MCKKLYMDDVLVEFSKCNTIAQAFDIFGKVVCERGYDKSTYACIYGDMELIPGLGPGVAANVPEEWLQEYRARKYYEIDPVVRCMPGAAGPFRWSTQTKLSDSQRQFMGIARDFGLAEGVTAPVYSPGECYAVSMACSACLPSKAFDAL